MKNCRFLQWPVIVLINSLLVLFATSCDSRKSSRANSLEKLIAIKDKAIFFLSTRPDSAVIYADSALTICRNTRLPDDSLIKFLYIKAAAFKGAGRLDSAVASVSVICEMATRNCDTINLARTSLEFGELWLNGENLQSAEKYLSEARNLYEHLVKQHLQASQLTMLTYQLGRAYNLYGFLLSRKGEYRLSQELLLKAYAINQKQGRLKAISGICINIGSNYSAIGSFREAITYYRKAEEAASKAHDTTNLIGVYRNIGVFYRDKQPDSSIYYYKRVLDMTKSFLKGQPDIITTYNLANVYSDKKDYDKALKLYNEVLDYCSEIRNPHGVINAMSGMAVVYAAIGKPLDAIACNKRAISLADSMGDVPLSVGLITELQNIYKDNNQFREALVQSEKAKRLNDSILSLNKQVAIHELDVKYQTEKKNQENLWLKSALTTEEKLSGYRFNFILVLLLATILLLLLLWRGFKLYRSRELAYKVLMSKHILESEQRNKDREKENESDLITDDPQPPADESSIINHQLLNYYKLEKPYHNPGLKIEDVSVHLNIPKRAISAVLKKFHDANFNSFTNRFRVEEAKQLMESDVYKNYTIEAIAREAGFGNRQSFYNTFEHHTGIKPGYYRNYVNNPAINAGDENPL